MLLWTPCTHGCDAFPFSNIAAPTLSFHSFPARSDLRSQWLINIRRDQFTISPHTKVCSRHFIPDHLIEPKTPEGRRRLTKDAVPLLFEWNGYSIQAPRLSVWERRERPADPTSLEDPSNDLTVDHDYCSAPEPSLLDMSCAENEDLSREVEELRNQLHELRVQLTFGLPRFSGSDEDIRFYTSHPSTKWFGSQEQRLQLRRMKMCLIHECQGYDNIFFLPKKQQQVLQPVDEFFLFLVHLSVGLKERDLGHRFNIHPSTVIRIISTWTNFLYTPLGSVCIWLSPEDVKKNLPSEFQDYPDTQVILDCIELRCQTPSSALLQSEMYSTYKSHCTMKGLVGIAPHGAVTFVSSLYAGSVSDKELFKQSGLAKLLTEEMAVMVDKGFLITDCVKCKVYCPPFLSKQSQMPAYQVTETQSIAHAAPDSISRSLFISAVCLVPLMMRSARDSADASQHKNSAPELTSQFCEPYQVTPPKTSGERVPVQCTQKHRWVHQGGGLLEEEVGLMAHQGGE
uniref:THAP-type domain-containing protein n=1 Tax=Pygocentrus nattereri TaxID=42514 RepID=A0AAR2IUP2_PYGNA